MNRDFKIGLVVISLFLIWGAVYSIFMNTPELDIAMELIKPLGKGPLLGTDIYGRSVFSIISAGISYSLQVAVMVTLLSILIGVIIGFLSTSHYKIIAVFMDLLINVNFVFPSILIAILVMSIMGQSSVGLILTLALTNWSGHAKITRVEVVRIKAMAFYESAIVLGVGPIRIFLTTIMPMILPLIIVNGVLGLSGVIVSESILGFLGLGGSSYSWGSMLAMGKNILLEAPHIAIIISGIMALMIIGLNLLGDGLRDILDPKTSN